MDMEKSNLDWINEAEADVEETHCGHHHQGTVLHIPSGDDDDDNEFEVYVYDWWGWSWLHANCCTTDNEGDEHNENYDNCIFTQNSFTAAST